MLLCRQALCPRVTGYMGLGKPHTTKGLVKRSSGVDVVFTRTEQGPRRPRMISRYQGQVPCSSSLNVRNTQSTPKLSPRTTCFPALYSRRHGSRPNCVSQRLLYFLLRFSCHIRGTAAYDVECEPYRFTMCKEHVFMVYGTPQETSTGDARSWQRLM
jgi:hypothetical protein